MDRRESMKSMLVGTLAGGLVINGCAPSGEPASQGVTPKTGLYGRMPAEIARDQQLIEDKFFSEHELETIAVLCDLILPASGEFGSANDAGVPEFIAFIAKDMRYQQVPLRGGLMWLDNRANRKFGTNFKSCTGSQHKELLDEIAYPDKATPEVGQGVRFFNLMRNLTLTGYYTTKMGIDALGYKGNSPNVWDGVPDDVLAEHGLAYDEEWLAKCIDQQTRNEIAKWDDNGNLLN
ncbi:MAG: gluconate 2-dehydrogenase subunit 3 family protein [Bacteroidetes bacterium]|nr:gluconate 2-dehydrogenase subunit 3 family protein [Bacteroidota bacterium]MDA1119424.1 gluconate 2-dehydrogenase subunit 3 family protein [Bacteroidota bacterium]